MADQESVKPDTPIITNPIKTKNPNRVAQGKRLAQISKQAKERKMRERIEREHEMESAQNSTRHDSDDDEEVPIASSIGYVLPIGLAGVGAYLVYKKYASALPVKQPQEEPPKEPEVKTRFLSPD